MTTPTVRSVDDLGNEMEIYFIQLNEQRYNQIAGLPYDKNGMETASETLANLSSEFLNTYNKPRSALLDCIALLAENRRLTVTLNIYEQRIASITSNKFKFRGKHVNWGSWRQFNASNTKSEDRKKLFDDFLLKSETLGSLISKRFKISQQVYSLYESSPLDAFLEKELISYEKLTDMITTIGEQARRSFLSAAEHFAPLTLEKESFEYYDDFYVARGRIYSPLNTYLEKKKPLKIVKNFLSNWGFEKNIAQIKVDSEDREKKSPSAFCFGIKIPTDVRVVYMRVSPFSDFTSVFHEFGHAIHGTSGNVDDPYWKRYSLPMSVAETFSTFLEMLLQNPLFLQQELGLSKEVIQEILDRRHFMNLYFLVFYSASALMKIEYWKRGYTIEEASARFQELTKRFFWEIPGDYWLLHHIMPHYDIYSPSYILANIRAKEWMDQMIAEYGEDFWCNKEAGAVYRDLAATRGDFDLSVWDMDPKPYLKEQSEFSFV